MDFLKQCAALTAAALLVMSAAEARDIVLVAGATGGTGSEIVKQLVAAGEYRVRALTRNAARARTRLPAGVEVVVGDVRDPGSLVDAVRGATYVISAVGSRRGSGASENGPQAVDFRGVENLAEAAGRAGVAQFVLISAMGTSKAENHPIEPLRPFLLAKAGGEDALRDSGVPYTIVKPGSLTDEPGGRTAVVFSQNDELGTGAIPRADVAAVCIAALGSADALGKTFEISSGAGAWGGAWSTEFTKLRDDGKLLDHGRR